VVPLFLPHNAAAQQASLKNARQYNGCHPFAPTQVKTLQMNAYGRFSIHIRYASHLTGNSLERNENLLFPITAFVYLIVVMLLYLKAFVKGDFKGFSYAVDIK